MDKRVPDVIVLGAGMAGLGAARALLERGSRVLVLEARDRVGGRVFSQRTAAGTVVELGAEFVHGRPHELWALIDEAGLPTTERDGVMLQQHESGTALAEDERAGSALAERLEELADLPHDITFAEWLHGSGLDAEERATLQGYVEGFNAGDAQRISARSLGVQQCAEDVTSGDRAWHITGGYAQIPEYLAQRVRDLGGEIRLGSEVTVLGWEPGSVRVTLRDGEVLTAPRCIVTLPLGVLQQTIREGGVRFGPEPAALAQARRMAMGRAIHLSLVFREAWWQVSKVAERDQLQRLSFLLTPGESLPVWWTAFPEASSEPSITGWVAGPRAAAFADRSSEELAAEACSALARVFAVPEARVCELLVSAHAHDWTADPFARGAYSYIPVGALDAPYAMAQPEADTLFFAGEHTDTTGHWGTVYAALRTGLRAAAQVLGER